MPVKPMRPNSAASCYPPRQGTGRLAAWGRLAYEYAVLYAGLVLFAAPLLAWSMLANVVSPVLPRRLGAALGQRAIMLIFRVFLRALTLSGLVKLDLGALDALRDERGLIIAPNHPCLLDVVLMVSRLPRVVCIMKAELKGNVILSGAARLAGYIRNDSAVSMIRVASRAVGNGGQLLIFPEGTRTLRKHVNAFKGGFALIAKTAGVPVQTVFIETNSPFLSKGWSLFRKPDFPLVYRARLGWRFEVDGEVKPFVAAMERYYSETLQAGARPRAATGPASRRRHVA